MAYVAVAILIAGHEYHPKSKTHWDRCCLSRERYLARRFRSESFVAITFNVSAGSVRKAVYRARSSAPTETVSPLREAIRQDQYKLLENGDNVPFKELDKIISITDIYSETLKYLTEFSGKIIELSFFSHAYSDGPILTNTWQFRRVIVENARATLIELRQQPNDRRDPLDLDPRKQDFHPKSQSDEALAAWRSAFAENGKSWIWGCNDEELPKYLMRVIRRARPPVTPSLRDDAVVRVAALNYELAAIQTLNQHLLKPTKSQGMYDVMVGELRSYILGRLSDTYAQRLADATRRKVYAAGAGTWATFQSNKVDMEIAGQVHDIVQTYRSAFGIRSDDEGNKYLLFQPN